MEDLHELKPTNVMESDSLKTWIISIMPFYDENFFSWMQCLFTTGAQFIAKIRLRKKLWKQMAKLVMDQKKRTDVKLNALKQWQRIFWIKLFYYSRNHKQLF